MAQKVRAYLMAGPSALHLKAHGGIAKVALTRDGAKSG